MEYLTKGADPLCRYIALGWKIMECKLQYYRPELVHKKWQKSLTVDDSTYDGFEDEYRKLADNLGLPISAIDMVGFDLSRPSAQLILSRYSAIKRVF